MAATFGAGIAPMRASSSFHCVRLRLVALAASGGGAVLPAVARRPWPPPSESSARAAAVGWKSIWIASGCARVASVFAAVGVLHQADDLAGDEFALEREQRADRAVGDRAGALVPGDRDAVDRGDVDRAAGVGVGQATGGAVDSLGPRCSACTVGFRPLRDRNASTASTRLSIAPEATSWRARASRVDARIGEHRQLELALGEQEHVARGGAEQGGSAPSLPAGAAPRRAPSSSRAPAGDRSMPVSPAGCTAKRR